MKQIDLSRLTGIRSATIHELYHMMAEKISFEHLDKICEVLDCSMSELFEYVPNKVRTTGKDLIIEEHGNRKVK